MTCRYADTGILPALAGIAAFAALRLPGPSREPGMAGLTARRATADGAKPHRKLQIIAYFKVWYNTAVTARQ